MQNPLVQQSNHTVGTEQGQFKQLANTIYQVTEDIDYDAGNSQKEYAKPKKSDADLIETYEEHNHSSKPPTRKQSRSHVEARSQAEIAEPKVVIDPLEVHKGLRELHARVDEVLRKTPNAKKDMYHSIAGTTLLDIERRGLNYHDYYKGVDYNNPFLGADIQVRTYEHNIATPIKAERFEEKKPVDPNYLKYSLSVTKHDRIPSGYHSNIQTTTSNDPNKFDKEKLDSIITRILSRQGQGVVTHAETSKVHVQEDTSRYYESRSHHEHESKQVEPSKYYCGELENDDDSLILGYLNEKIEKVEKEARKDHTYFCGGLEDDE
jgi:hypothetical protein